MLLLTAAVLLVFCAGLFAQNVEKGDTLVVSPTDENGQPLLGALNMAIHGDTTEAGEQAHSVYELIPNAQYILTEVLQLNAPMTIYAPEPADDKRPPVVRCGLKEDGSPVNNLWHIYDDVAFKNIWFSGVNLDGTGPIAWILQTVQVSGIEISYDGCIMEFPYTWWASFADWGGMNVYKINDCIFQYVGNPTGTTWNGAIFNGDGSDSLIVRNSTFFDFGCFAVKGAYYTEIDHCTFVNSVVHPIDSHRHIKKVFTNNLFVNCHAFSDDYDEISRHFDQEVKGIMNYAEIQWDPQALDSLWGPGGVYGKTYDPDGDGVLEEEELVWTLENNAWWYTQPIKDYWDAWDNVIPNPWMNDYNTAMFENQDGPWSWTVMTYTRDTNDVIVDSAEVTVDHEPYEFFTEENTMNLDPGIVDMNGTDELLAQNCTNIRLEWAGEEVTPVEWHGVDNYLAFTWPLDYDLSYTNSTLQTAGRNGNPVGSLQWWDIEYEPTAIDNKVNVAEEFALAQNYPNPFNPTTTINYQLGKPANVKLTVYDIMGREVKTLVNTSKNVGSYNAVWDATNNHGNAVSTGVYFYRLQAGDRTFVKKMMLMK